MIWANRFSSGQKAVVFLRQHLFHWKNGGYLGCRVRGLGGEETKPEALGLVAAKVGIQGRKGMTGANGESSEIGVHPDLG